jgi:DNA-directed RNA polymerase subunit beta
VLVRRSPQAASLSDLRLQLERDEFLGATTEISSVTPDEVQLMDVSPKQIVSVAAALIPFLEHDDANRALMGANMQRQAVPAAACRGAVHRHRHRGRAARDAADMVLAEEDGVIVEVDGSHVVVDYKKSGKRTYKLNKFERSNQDTCINQRPRVPTARRSRPATCSPRAPRPTTASWRSARTSSSPSWPGRATTSRTRSSSTSAWCVTTCMTSIHIKEHEVDARDTKLGPEEITRDIPNLSEEILADLDERGIIRVGAEVSPGDVLVGKVTPKGETELTPEERLLRAIFGEKAREVRDTSLKVPHGETGKVIDVKVFSRDDEHELPPGVNQLVRVYVGQKRKISVGDKLAGRHGNKGVISRILPSEDMPFLEDGTPVDII